MTHRIAVLKGDGIGPEVTEATVLVLQATGLPFEFEILDFGEATDGIVPQDIIDAIRASDAAIKGPTATPLGEGHRSLNVQLREKLGLYANVRPIRTMPGVTTPFSDRNLDFVIIRENLEDLYIGEEREIDGGYEAVARFTRKGCLNIAHFAFGYARSTGRERVSIGHKSNIQKMTHGLFLRTAQDIAYAYGITTDQFIADTLGMQLVMRPERFNNSCILLPNFVGDILSDVAAGLVGGLGLVPGANIGDHAAVFEAVHGTAPDIAGKGIANPTALILSAAMMLDHLGERAAAQHIRFAVDAVLHTGEYVTADVNPRNSVSTMEYARHLTRFV